MKTIKHDSEFDNAMLFWQYVMVTADGKMSGGGLVEAFNQEAALIGGRWHSRSECEFVPGPPPQCPQ